jgi:hypothetical protein
MGYSAEWNDDRTSKQQDADHAWEAIVSQFMVLPQE